MSANALEVANIALTAIGTRIISNLTDPTREARTINQHFGASRRAVLRDHTWNFAKKRVVLTTIASVPPAFDFLYGFVLPDDFIRVVDVQEVTTSKPLDSKCWRVEGQNVLTNSTSLNLRYIFDCENEELFDAMFSECLGLYLAWKCCFILTGSSSRDATLKQNYMDALKRAKFVNATENPPEVVGDRGSWLDAHDGSINQGFVRDPGT